MKAWGCLFRLGLTAGLLFVVCFGYEFVVQAVIPGILAKRANAQLHPGMTVAEAITVGIKGGGHFWATGSSCNADGKVAGVFQYPPRWGYGPTSLIFVKNDSFEPWLVNRPSAVQGQQRFSDSGAALAALSRLNPCETLVLTFAAPMWLPGAIQRKKIDLPVGKDGRVGAAGRPYFTDYE